MISKESVGVDISRHQLTIAYAKATPLSTRVCAHAVYGLEAASSFAEKLDSISKRVKDFLRQHRIGSTCLWIGLPAEMVIQRVVRLPAAAKENLAKALEYELPKYMPLASEDIYFRYQVLAEDRIEKQLTILLAAVKKRDLTPLIELRNRLGAGICGAESAATAAINGLKWASKPISEKSHALAYAADGTLHLGFFEAERLQYIRTLDLSDELMYQSEQTLRELALTDKTSAETDAAAAITVYCRGPGATAATLEKLNQLPNLAFNLLEPGQTFLGEEGAIAAAGLAVKGLQRVPVDINLFPEQFRKKPSVVARYMTLTLVMLTLITAMAWAGSYLVHQRVAATRVDRELDELSDEIKALGQVESEIAALQVRIDYLNGLRQQGIPALDFLKELTEILPETAWLIGLSASENKAEIEGYADSSTQLIQQLEASPFFANAKFVSTITKGKDGKEVFKIGIDLKRP